MRRVPTGTRIHECNDVRRHRGGRGPQRPHGLLLPRPGGSSDARRRAARRRGRRLRHGGDRARLPRLHDVLHRLDAPAGGDPRPRPRAPRPADGAVRARAPGGVRGRHRAAVVDRSRSDGAGVVPRQRPRRGDVRPHRHPLETARPLPPAVLPRGAAERPRAPVGSRPGGPACLPADQGDRGRRDHGPRRVPDRLARRLPRPALRDRDDQTDVPGEQRVRDALPSVSAGHGDRLAVPPAVGRRRRRPGLVRARDRRHGVDHAGDGRRRTRGRCRDPHRGAGRAHPRRGRPRPGRDAGRWHRAPVDRRGFERGPEADVPRAG